MVKMKKLIFLILLFFILNAIKLYCYYYPYPILMVHGRGDTAQFWNYHGAMPGFRQYMYQYFPLNNEEYHVMLPISQEKIKVV